MWMSKGLIKKIDRKGKILSSTRKPWACTEINREFEIEEKEILFHNLIQFANSEKKFV